MFSLRQRILNAPIVKNAALIIQKGACRVTDCLKGDFFNDSVS